MTAGNRPAAAVDTVHSQTYVVHREQYGDDWVEATFRDRAEAEAFIERYYEQVGGRDDDWSLYIADEPSMLIALDNAFTTPTTLDSGLYLSMPQGHARVSDGRREVTVVDLGGVVQIGGIEITDPAVLEGLGDHLKLLAERRRRDLAEPYRLGAPADERTQEPRPQHAPRPVVDVPLPEPQLSLDLPG